MTNLLVICTKMADCLHYLRSVRFSHTDNIDNPDLIKALEIGEKVHADLLALSGDNWVSVDYELPQPFKNVLVLNNTGKVGIGFVGNSDWWSYNPTGGFNDYQAKSDFFESDLMNVKYWQPLPEPPKE